MDNCGIECVPVLSFLYANTFHFVILGDNPIGFQGFLTSTSANIRVARGIVSPAFLLVYAS